MAGFSILLPISTWKKFSLSDIKTKVGQQKRQKKVSYISKKCCIPINEKLVIPFEDCHKVSSIYGVKK